MSIRACRESAQRGWGQFLLIPVILAEFCEDQTERGAIDVSVYQDYPVDRSVGIHGANSERHG
jgi:hypothetical protein